MPGVPKPTCAASPRSCRKRTTKSSRRDFASKPFKSAKQTVDPSKVAAGKTLHVRDCEKCHEGNGRKADADASILAGQWMPYLTTEMNAFVAGKRPQPKKMAEKVRGPKPADVEALVHFYASQP